MASAGAKRKRTPADEKKEEEQHDDEDLISRLHDSVLGHIVSLLPTIDGARTQVLSSRWRHLWRSSPLHLSFEKSNNKNSNTTNNGARPLSTAISRVLAAHPGPGSRFSVPQDYFDYRDMPAAAIVDGWLRSPALAGLHDLEVHHARSPFYWPPPSLPASVLRFSSTLRVASFGGFSFTDVFGVVRDGNGNGGGCATGMQLQFAVLQRLTLTDVRINETSLHALLAACPVLQSLLLDGKIGCSRIEVTSPTIRSVGICSVNLLQELVIKDAPCLERLLLDSYGVDDSNEIAVSVIYAPKLYVLGPLSAHGIRLDEFGSTIFQTVKILVLIQEHLSLDAVIDSMKCFPCLEKLYIKTKMAGEKNVWCRKHKDLISSLDIRLKKIVLTKYRGNPSHVNFAKFFVLNARLLQHMRLELYHRNPSSDWIEKQHRLLQIKNKASRDMQLDFATNYISNFFICNEQVVHDFSAAGPF